ncbi:MAG TPA: nitrate- and nitrite sensing domain-containing protein, partial [Acidimicrobiales bacterium]
MLRTMKVRSKLAVILAAPICALLVLGGWGATDRLEVAQEAADGTRFIELGAAAGSLTHELQKEMLLSIGSLAQVVDLTPEELATQRQATDQAMARFQDRLAATEALLGPSGSWRSLRSTGDELAQYREQVDAGVGETGNFAVFYGRIAGAVEDLIADLTTAAASVTPEVAGRLTSLTALTAAKSLFAEQAATLVRVFATHELADGDREQLVDQSGRYDTQLSVFYATATGGAENLLRDQLRSGDAVAAQRTLDGVLRGEAGSLTGGAATWEQSASAQIDALRQVERRLADGLVASARDVASATARDVRLYGAVAIGAVLLALVLALVVARSLTRPLRRLTAAAYQLSRERLPALVDALHRSGGEDLDTELTPIPVDSHDEIGQLADAFNTVQAVAAQVADEQRQLLRKGIGDTFVTLARRNQGLIDRQISFLDELEATEQDPDTLEHLFQLDHLATRMRRNAESLLVLAGVEQNRRRGQPVQLADAVRAAVSEVQDFNRVDLLVLDDGAVDGNVAVDLAHLLAELMENATAFSPPETRVEIVGHLTRDGYVLSVTDQGIGMSDAQIEEANAVLAKPPVVGLSLSRSLGFIVVSRLASRSGVAVRLTHSVAGGVTAVVTVPPALLVDLGPAELEDAAVTDVDAPWSPPADAVPAAAPAPQPAPVAASATDGPLPARRGAVADPAAALPQRAAPVTAANGSPPPRTAAQAATDALLT